MIEPDDDPLSAWYASRNGSSSPVGTRDAINLQPGPQREAALFKDTPRLVVEWDGIGWQPIGVTQNYAEAYQLISSADRVAAFPQSDTPVLLLRMGTGRHRKS